MHSFFPSFILGYHGCDRDLGEKVLTGKLQLAPSTNDYDWLGNVVYFWEGNPSRALEYATFIKNNPNKGRTKITSPFVLGAILDLRNCFNLLEREYLGILKQGYELLKDSHERSGRPLPQNTSPIGEERDLLLRKLDCAVIETVHAFYRETEKPVFDTVRGIFVEGKALYDNSGFHEKNHIQVCVRNNACIKGFFRPVLS